MLHTVKKNMYEPKGKSLVIRLKLALLRSVRLEDYLNDTACCKHQATNTQQDLTGDVMCKKGGLFLSASQAYVISDRRLTRVFILEDPSRLLLMRHTEILKKPKNSRRRKKKA